MREEKATSEGEGDVAGGGGEGIQVQIWNCIMAGRVGLLMLNCMGSIHKAVSASRPDIESG